MLKQIIVVALMIMVSNVAVFAAGSGKSNQDDTAKVRAQIAKIGIGRDAEVTVKLRNGKKLKGYVSETKADSFVVTDSKTGSQTEVQYSDVSKIKGQNLPLGVTIAIVAGVIIGLTFLFGSILKN